MNYSFMNAKIKVVNLGRKLFQENLKESSKVILALREAFTDEEYTKMTQFLSDDEIDELEDIFFFEQRDGIA